MDATSKLGWGTNPLYIGYAQLKRARYMSAHNGIHLELYRKHQLSRIPMKRMNQIQPHKSFRPTYATFHAHFQL